MTTNEIKTLIQNTIAGQGSQVDIGGKLAEILGAIVDAIPSGEMTRPIVLSRLPDSNDTLEDLAGIGLTLEEIQEAARGNRIVVVCDGTTYPITIASYLPDGEWHIAFSYSYYDGTGVLTGLTGSDILYSSDELVITNFEM